VIRLISLRIAVIRPQSRAMEICALAMFAERIGDWARTKAEIS
jgi:hypothetical protein